MTILLFANQAQTTLALPVATTDTTITVAGGTGQYFPQPIAGQAFKLTLINAINSLITEICNVTNVTGDVLTVQRAQEGTVALSWQVGDFAANLVTAGTMQNFGQGYAVSGQSGYSGYSGYSGMGISGYSGFSGSNGVDGQSGYSGISGYSGSGI